MKRQFPRIERRALLGLAAALTTLGAACSPNQSVQPGAPVLTEIKIVEGNGATVTSIPSDVAECPALDGGTSGGMCDPKVTICRLSSASNWCSCVPNPAPPGPPAPDPCVDAGTTTADAGTDAGAPADAAATDAAAVLGGTWSCTPFSPTAVALFVFDRVLDTKPLDPGDAGGTLNPAMLTIAPTPPVSVALNADYASNGTPNEVIFPLLGAFRSDGPSLLFAGQPAFPATSAVTITLDANKVRAKDGKTVFTGPGFFAGGTLTYTTASFSASVTTPPTTPPAADAGVCTPPPITVTPDKTPATVTFNNFVDPTVIASHITITAGGVPVTFTVTSMDGLNVSVVPDANWPASSTITITVDATAPDLVGDTLGAPVSGSFTTSAN